MNENNSTATIRIAPFGLSVTREDGIIEYVSFLEGDNPIYEIELIEGN